MKQKLFLDVAMEAIQKKELPLNEKRRRNLQTSHFKVDEESRKALKRSKGDYFTITYTNNSLLKHSKSITKELIHVLKTLLRQPKKDDKTLIIGLGNSSVLADALGPKTTNKIIATNHFDDFLTIPKLALFVPEVIGKTGISSYRLIEMLVANLKPSTIIVIDSLATNSECHLNNCIEVSDTGIIPGSALRTNKEISSKTFGIPVISIGIPLMLNINDSLYTSPDIADIIDKSSDVISNAINSIYLS